MAQIEPQTKVCCSIEEVCRHLAPRIAQGESVVSTNGCFDLLHSGHIRYLAEAARLGDILIVGVNADATVRKLKGEGRPLQNEADRALIIAALACVDYSFVFPEDDPRAFLEILKPRFHVKGGDYSPDIIERPVVERNGGQIAIVSFVAGRSTTGIIDRMATR